jgi:hypothetical protein
LSDRIASVTRGRYSWAPSAFKHGVSPGRSRYVIEHCGLPYSMPAEPPGRPDERILFLGDDHNLTALEVMAVELQGGRFRVIHSMIMRARLYEQLYEEAKKWRT